MLSPAQDSPFPVARTRADTPASEGVNHLNNAGCSLPTQQVLDAQLEHLALEATIGGYEAEAQVADQLGTFYTGAAALLGAQPSELAYTSGAGDAWWRAFGSVPLEAGDRVLVSRHEYISGGLGLIQASRSGISVEYVPDDANGLVDLEALEAMLDERVKLVCMTHLPMTNGLINPAAEVGRLAKTVGARYLLDSCQAVGQLPLDVTELQCDFLTGTGRKWLRAMRGGGLLYVRAETLEGLKDPSFLDGASATWTGHESYELKAGAKRYEMGEYSVAGKVGFARALGYANDLGIDRIRARVLALATQLRSELAEIGVVTVHDVGTDQSGIVTFNVAGTPAPQVCAALATQGIHVGAPPRAASWLDMTRTNVESVVRASPHYYNSTEEVSALSSALRSL